MGYRKYTLLCILVMVASRLEAAPPQARDNYFKTDEPVISISIGELLSNDTDPDGDTLSFLGHPDDMVNGSVSVDNNVIEWRFEPNESKGQFTYLVDDGTGKGWQGSYGYAHVFIELTSSSGAESAVPTPTAKPELVLKRAVVAAKLPRSTSSSGGVKSVNQYIFGHSLISHGLSPNAVETNVPHWLALFAKAAGYEYSASGKYGFLPEPPAEDKIGWSTVKSGWNTRFSDSHFNQLLVTAFNFGLEIPPDRKSYLGATPTAELQKTIEWANKQSPGIKTYLYESWPAMDDFVAPWPVTEKQFDKYNKFTKTKNAAWWDKLAESADVEFVPVARLLAELYSGILDDIPVKALYEDGSPHGTANTYFLAAIIVYTAIYDEAPPLIRLPDSIHPVIHKHYEEVVRFVDKKI